MRHRIQAPLVLQLLLTAAVFLGACKPLPVQPSTGSPPCGGFHCVEGSCDGRSSMPVCTSGGSDGGLEPRAVGSRMALPEELLPLSPMAAPVEAETTLLSRYLVFEATAGRWYRFTSTCPSPHGCWAAFADETGLVVASSADWPLSWEESAAAVRVAFKAEQTGRALVLLDLGPGAGSPLQYTYQLEELPDDHGDGPETATPFSERDVLLVGRGEAPADRDVFAFTAQQGELFHVSCIAEHEAGTSLTHEVRGPSRSLSRVPDIWDTAVFEAAESGTHTLAVEAGWLAAKASVAFSCRFRGLAFDDVGDVSAEATPLPASGQFEGWLETPTDTDAFSAELSPDRFYALGCESGPNADCQARVLGPSGETLARTAPREEATFSPPGAGTYTVVVSGKAIAPYTVRLVALGADDHGEGPDSATLVAPGTGTVQGVLEEHTDVDAFAFDAVAGRAYTFSCEGEWQSGGTLWRLALLGPDGAVVASQGVSPGALLLAPLEAPAAERYVAEVSLDRPVEGPLRYTCRLVDRGVDAHGDSPEQATLLAPSTQLVRLELPGDADVFAFAAEAGHFVDVRWELTQCLFPEYSGAAVRILRADGSFFAGASQPGTSSLRISEAGTYFIALQSVEGSWPLPAICDYRLTLEDRGVDDHGDTLETATPLPLGVPAQGRDQGGADVDVFSFEATAKTFYRVTCTPSDPSGSCNVFVGDLLLPVDPDPVHPHARMLEAADAGPLGIRIDATDAYTLLLEYLATDDHGGTAARATPLVLGSATAGVLDTVSDHDVFVITVEAGRTYRLQVSAGYVFNTQAGPMDGLSSWRIGNGEFTPDATGQGIIEVFPATTTDLSRTGSYEVRVDLLP